MNAIHTQGTARYHDVAAAVHQASSSTLAETLHALHLAELVSRQDLSDVAGPHTVYA